jgi:hypothetical protein
MSRRRKKAQRTRSAATESAVAAATVSAIVADGPFDAAVIYAEACGLAAQGKKARRGGSMATWKRRSRAWNRTFDCGR